MNRHERRKAKAVHGWVPMRPAIPVSKTPEELQALADHVRRVIPEATEQQIREQLARAENELREVWKNDLYTCWVIRQEEGGHPGIIHLSIKRNDLKAVHDWRHFQRIKTEIIGPENEAVELYPAESRLVDSATQYHLWVFADPKFRVPVGWEAGRIVTSDPPPGGDQRPLDD